jgi:hypothetical protein
VPQQIRFERETASIVADIKKKKNEVIIIINIIQVGRFYRRNERAYRFKGPHNETLLYSIENNIFIVGERKSDMVLCAAVTEESGSHYYAAWTITAVRCVRAEVIGGDDGDADPMQTSGGLHTYESRCSAAEDV